MELEFDKEIDVILRKARGTSGAASGSTASVATAHLDADTISAFAENALPEKARLLYIEHFADCDRCRTQLTHSVRLSAEAAAEPVAAASPDTAAAAVTGAWYKNLLRTPNLAFVMGALVLVFVSALGFLVLQNRNEPTANALSKVENLEERRGGPYFNSDAAPAEASNANTSTNVPAAAATPGAAANSTAVAANTAATSNTGLVGRLGTPATGAPVTDAPDRDEKPVEKSATGGASPPPAPVTTEDTTAGDDLKRGNTDKAKEENKKDAELSTRKQPEDQRYRDAPPAAAKTGPSRSVGPLGNQSNQINTQIFDMPVTQIVGGKSFSNRNGAWYDAAYHGQGLTSVRRGSDDFKKLDSSVRNIANTLGGTVIVVWKEKAYRIQ